MRLQRDISHFGMIDWDFRSEDSRSFIHNFCWYPSRFIPIIPSHLIQSLSRPGETVLDPYCGSGTTILESLKLGRNAVGIDLNPIATFIAKVKVDVLQRKHIDLTFLGKFNDHLQQLHASSQSSLFKSESLSTLDRIRDDEIPNYDENRKWYHPYTLKMLAYLYFEISKIDNEGTCNLLKLFFISILMPATGHENKKPYTYYADNVKPKDLLYKDVINMFSSKINKFIKEYSKNEEKIYAYGTIINGDVRELLTLLPNNTNIDLIVTSPPYLGVTDYITAYRLVHLWNIFDIEIGELKKKEIGARWKRKSFNALTAYMSTINQSIIDMSRVVKEGGYICLILGEAKKHQDKLISDLQEFAVTSAGLKLQDTYSRNVSKNFFISPKGGVPTENILIFQRC